MQSEFREFRASLISVIEILNLVNRITDCLLVREFSSVTLSHFSHAQQYLENTKLLFSLLHLLAVSCHLRPKNICLY
jgi:hypothetical protein